MAKHHIEVSFDAKIIRKIVYEAHVHLTSFIDYTDLETHLDVLGIDLEDEDYTP